ncbi:MAG: KEOPS complex subunit Pcc1 [Halobacteriaceae archaeon]
MHRTDLVFTYPTAERAATIERAVAREAGDIEGDRTDASVSLAGRELTVSIEAADLVALRAGHNTWCSLVEAAERAAAAGERAAGGPS